MTRRTLTALLLALVVGSAHAIDLAYGSIDPDEPNADNAIILTGEVKRGDYEVLRRFAAKDKHRFHSRTVVLASQGGDLLEAARIGTFLRKAYMSVFVNSRIGRCASACFLIYVAAIERDTSGPGLGIHRPYFAASEFAGASLQDAEQKHRQLMQAVKAYLEEQQVPAYLIEKMFGLASSEIHWLSSEDVNNIGRRAHWWDQVLVDRCRLNKKLESEYLADGEDAPRAAQAKRHIHEVAVCAYEVSAQQRLKNLDQLLRQSR